MVFMYCPIPMNSSALRVPTVVQLKKLTSFDNQHHSTGPFDSGCTEAFASLFQ